MHLVLLGLGHAHVAALESLAARPPPGVRLTLITREPRTPYSGMLPGLVAGHYGPDDIHIDAGPLARFAGARLLRDEAVGLDLRRRLVLRAGGPPVPFDLLALDIGSAPGADPARVAPEVVRVKPIGRFVERWEEVARRIVAAGGRARVAVVGTGAAGVELTLAMRHGLGRRLRAHGLDPDGPAFTLLGQADTILPEDNPGARRRFMRILAARGVRVLTGHEVTAAAAGRLQVKDRTPVEADAIFWATAGASVPWLAAAGLAVDARGFVRVDRCLRSLSHPFVFAAGDVAALADPRPKAGVFAVRAGPPLAENLRRVAADREPLPFRPQRDWLRLVSTGNKRAVAIRGRWSAEGAWLWRWKDRIDRRFVRRFSDLPAPGAGR